MSRVSRLQTIGSNHNNLVQSDQPSVFVQNGNSSTMKRLLATVTLLTTMIALPHVAVIGFGIPPLAQILSQKIPIIVPFSVFVSLIVVCALLIVKEPLHGLKLSRLVIKNDGKELEIYFETSITCLGLKNWTLKSHSLLVPLDEILLPILF